YLAALSAMRSGSPLVPFVLRLRERGKAGKSIAIVVARKL
ncbi:MAG: IS110 family transposase, partial [Alphaproteobacteria bacterium]